MGKHIASAAMKGSLRFFLRRLWARRMETLLHAGAGAHIDEAAAAAAGGGDEGTRLVQMRAEDQHLHCKKENGTRR